MPNRITSSQAAERLDLSRRQVQNLLNAGLLTGELEAFGPGQRWMVDVASVKAHKKRIDRGEVKPGPRGKE